MLRRMSTRERRKTEEEKKKQNGRGRAERREEQTQLFSRAEDSSSHLVLHYLDPSQDHVASGNTCSAWRMALNKPGSDCSFPLQQPSSLTLLRRCPLKVQLKPQRQQKFDVTSGRFAPRLCSAPGEVISQAERLLPGRNVAVTADSLPCDGRKSSEITRIVNKKSVYSGVCHDCPLIECLIVSWDSLTCATVSRETKKPRLET